MSDIWHTKDIRRHCEYIIDSYEDELAATYISWLSKASGRHNFEFEQLVLELEVCYKVTQSCPETSHDLAEFEDDGSGKAERKYRSEPIPARVRQEKGFISLSRATHMSFLLKTPRLTLAYVALPSFSVPSIELSCQA